MVENLLAFLEERNVVHYDHPADIGNGRKHKFSNKTPFPKPERRFLPEQISKKLPASYQSLPATLLGRLARDLKYNGERLGELLLIDALKRSYDASLRIGSIAVVVDPIDEAAQNFYLRYGFIDLPDSGKMFLSMKTIANLFV